MFKICSLEMKKLLSRIWFYGFLVLLVGILVASAFAFEPTKRENPSITLPGETVNEIYNNFTKDGGIKQNFDQNVSSVVSSADIYINTDVRVEIKDLFQDFDNACFNFNDKLNSMSTQATKELIEGINIKLDNLTNTLDKYLDHSKNQTGYYILVTDYNYTTLYSTLNKIRANFTSPTNYQAIATKYCETYSQDLTNNLNNLIYPKLNEPASRYKLNSHLNNITTLRLEEINQKIVNLNNEALSDSALNNNATMKAKLIAQINNYINVCNLYTESYSSAICAEALSTLSNTTRKDLVGYSNVLLHEKEDEVIIKEYCILHNLNPQNYSTGLSATHTSNYNENAYDFTYFVMSIIGVAVTILAIYMSARSISGEKDTLRMLALRPVKRSGIFFGKYLATLLTCLIIMIIGFGASFAVGSMLFGVDSANILMVINSQFVVIMHPVVALILYALSLLLIIAIYSAITLTLSACVKNEIVVAIIMLVFYLFNTTLPVFFDVYSWLRFYPFANINLMAFFSGNRLTDTSTIAKLFNSEIYFGMNIWICLSYIIVITTLILLIGKTIFRKKDL